MAADGTGSFSSLPEALAQAPVGATLVLRAGRYEGPIAIERPVEIRAEGRVEIVPPDLERLLAPFRDVHATARDWLREGLLLLGRSDAEEFWQSPEWIKVGVIEMELLKALGGTARPEEARFREHLQRAPGIRAALGQVRKVVEETIRGLIRVRADARICGVNVALPSSWDDAWYESARPRTPGLTALPSWKDAWFAPVLRGDHRVRGACVVLQGDLTCTLEGVEISGGHACIEVEKEGRAHLSVVACTLADAPYGVQFSGKSTGTFRLVDSLFRRVEFQYCGPKTVAKFTRMKVEGCKRQVFFTRSPV